jgi:CubicO group peptidase (beta-lactamase class C family)
MIVIPFVSEGGVGMFTSAGGVPLRMTSGMSLPDSTPAAEGVDPRGVQDFLDAVESPPEIEPHGLIVMRHGRVVASGWWAPYRADRPHLLYSLSKSFTSTALGFAVDEGLLRLDDRVVDFFPELAIDETRTRSMRVRDLAAMSSGHLTDTWCAVFTEDPDDPVRGFLRLRPDHDPGAVFAYNQPATYTLAAILQQVAGRTLTEFLRPRLFDPIGVDFASWQQYPQGRDIGFTGLFATTDTIARLGELYLRRGLWNGRRVIPEYWVAEATRPHITTAGEPNPDWRQGYGFQFWMSRHGYRGDGAYGQFCLVLPDQDAVIAYTGATVEMQSVLDAVWRCLLPAFGDRAYAPATEDASLADRLAGLILPTVPAEPNPASEPESWSRPFTPAGGRCTDQPSLTSVEVAPHEPAVVLREAGSELRLRLGHGEWAVSEPTEGPGGTPVPVAVSGGWVDTSTLRFDALFLETPHRLRVTCDLATGTFDATWATAPLHPLSLREMHAPRRPARPLSTLGPSIAT